LGRDLKLFLLIFTLFSISVYGDSKIYVGLGYSNTTEKFDDIDAQSSSDSAQIKIGYGMREAYAIELSLYGVQNESNIFSSNDGDKVGADIELVKAFDLNTFIYPFFKAGFGTGYMEVQRELQDKLNYGSFNFGVGAFVALSDAIDLEASYKYKSISYESVDMVSELVNYKSNASIGYFGINARF
jgi:opacity protein-like surface antigen